MSILLRARFAGICLAVVSLAILSSSVRGQEEEKKDETSDSGKGFAFHRKVQLPQSGSVPPVVVCEFFTHGELDPQGAKLAVIDARKEPVPWKVLQVGPGDFCRVAFQTVSKQHQYRIEYGGKPEAVKSPEWTAEIGLLLVTKHWRGCNLNDLNSVKGAFDAAEPFGGDFVPNVYHRFNPINPAPEPFLSRYQGTLRVLNAGKYTFFTTSQDGSFLVIDGKVVASAPGSHGPNADTRHKGEVDLTAGPHKFEYHHGASGSDACMVAAWQTPRGNKAEPIPPGAFGSDAIAHVPALGPYGTGDRLLRDFVYEVIDEVPLADSNEPLIHVKFRPASAKGSSSGTRLRWDFGDGQTATAAEVDHVYLHPGLYSVTLTAGEATGLAAKNQVLIDRALVLGEEKRKPEQLATYLPLLERYDASKLDPKSVVQLVRAYDQAEQASKVARVGKAWLTATPPPEDQDTINTIVRIVGPMLRDKLDDAEGALVCWRAAAKAVKRAAWAADYGLVAADIALHDLLRPEEAKKDLDAATAKLKGANEPALSARLHGLSGDYFAREGDKDKARAEYLQALAQQGNGRSTVEQDAWRGAFSRSTEAFLRDKDFDRALGELRKWQHEFPGDAYEGYLPLLQARYAFARDKYLVAIALANDLVAVNPDSPYADRLVFLAAESEEKQGHTEQAKAAFKSLTVDYPGSPLVTDAKERLAKLEAKSGRSEATKSNK